MTTQDKYDFIIKEYKSLDGAMISVDNSNIYNLYKNYNSKPRASMMYFHPDGSSTTIPNFTNDLILLINLLYKKLKK